MKTINLLNLLKKAKENDITVSVNIETGTISAVKQGTIKSLETGDIVHLVEWLMENLD